MAQYKIAIFVGSLRRDSLNRKLAETVVTLMPPQCSCAFIPIAALPPYNQDDDADPAISVKDMKTAISAAHGLIFVTPEYNRSIPGVLKNAIDHASRPYGQSVWRGKPAGILGISPNATGTAMAQQHLRNVLASLDVQTLTLPEVFIPATEGFFDDRGGIDVGGKKFLLEWVNRYIEWVKKFSA